MMRGTARECMIKSRQEVPTTYKREVSMWCRVGRMRYMTGIKKWSSNREKKEGVVGNTGEGCQISFLILSTPPSSRRISSYPVSAISAARRCCDGVLISLNSDARGISVLFRRGQEDNLQSEIM